MYALYHPEKKEFVFVGITEDSYDSLMVQKALIRQSDKSFDDKSSLFVSETEDSLVDLMEVLNGYYQGNAYGRYLGDYVCTIDDLVRYEIVKLLVARKRAVVSDDDTFDQQEYEDDILIKMGR